VSSVGSFFSYINDARSHEPEDYDICGSEVIEGYCHLWCDTKQSGRHVPMFLRQFLPPSSECTNISLHWELRHLVSLKYLQITTRLPTVTSWKRLIFEYDNFVDLRMLWLLVSAMVFGDVTPCRLVGRCCED